MEYTIPSAEIVAEAFTKSTPTNGQIEFAGKIRQEFSQFISDGVSVFDAAEVGAMLDDFVGNFSAVELLHTFRNVTGQSTDDVDHASAVIYAAASQAWALIVSDWEIALQEN